MNPEEEERRRVAAEIARRMVDESGPSTAEGAERFDAGSYADDRALAALARPPAVRAPGRPGEAAQAIDEARGPQEEHRGATASQGVIIGGPGRGTAPWPAEQRERVASVESRLQSGERAGVERDTRLEQAGTPPLDDVEDRALAQMARPAVSTPTQDPMEAQAAASGSDPGMSLPEPSLARRAPPSFQLREQSMADTTDMEPWWASGDEPPRPEARLDGAPERDAALEAMQPDGDVDDVALAGLAGAQRPAAARPSPPPALLDPGFAKPVEEHVPGEMIPGAADIDRARLEDGFRRPLHNLANALRAIGGRGRTEFRSGEDATRVRQRQMTADKQRMRGQDEASRRAASQDAQRAQAAEASQALATRTADRQDEALELQRQAAARADATAQAQAGVLGERAATARSERERTEARSTPGTEEARRAQTQLQALVNTLPPGASRDRFVEALVGPGMSIDQLSADEVREVMQRAPEWLRAGLPRASRGGRGGGGGAPGSGTPRAAMGTEDDPLVQAAIEAGTDPRVARVAAADPSMRRQLARTLSGSDVRSARQDEVQEQVSRIPGWQRRADAPRMGERAAAGIRQVSVADGEFRRAVERIESATQGLTAAERAQGMAGLGTQRYREIEHALEVIRTQLRAINNAGNSLGAQHQAEASIPGLAQIPTVDALLNNVRAASAVKHDYVLSLMEANGYEPAGGGGHGGGSSAAERTPPPAAAGERVTIVLPDGRRATVPESQVEAALERGARRAE